MWLWTRHGNHNLVCFLTFFRAFSPSIPLLLFSPIFSLFHLLRLLIAFDFFMFSLFLFKLLFIFLLLLYHVIFLFLLPLQLPNPRIRSFIVLYKFVTVPHFVALYSHLWLLMKSMWQKKSGCFIDIPYDCRAYQMPHLLMNSKYVSGT
jgi:hypothetical protein